MTLDARGNLYVLDLFLAQILVLSPSGELLRTIGREGSGPGEYIRPRAFALGGDTLRVIDIGNGRLQSLALDTDFMRSTVLPAGSNLGEHAVNAQGWLLASTMGRLDALVSYHDPSGNQVGTLGNPPAAASTMLDFTSMKKEIVAGNVPALMRNSAMPVFAPNGDIWLILMGEGEVQRYDSAGSLKMTAPIVAPEMELIWDDVVERNKATMGDERRLRGLAYVSDATVVDQTLWALLNMPEGEPAVMLAFGVAGMVEHKVVFTSVIGAKKFVVDRAGGRIYFAIWSNASLVAARWPGEL
jgi:hypothetical protein